VAPYLNKAFTIDDPWFLLEARQILKTPVQPMSFPICWMGEDICLKRAGAVPPGAAQGLMGYLLVPVILTGGAEWVAHLIELLLACVAVLAMVDLALRLGFSVKQSTAGALLLVALPPFLPMTNTAMPDLPAAALALAGTTCALAWKQERRRWAGVGAAVLLALASYARPQIALLLPVLAILLLDNWRPREAVRELQRDWWRWVPIEGALFLLAIVNVLTHDPGPPQDYPIAMIGLSNIEKGLPAYLTYVSFPIPFSTIWIATRRGWTRIALLVVPGMIAILPYTAGLLLNKPRLLAFGDWSIFAVVYGGVALAHMAIEQLRQRDHVGVFLAAWVLIPLPAIFYQQFPLKYMLAVLPALVLIMMRALGETSLSIARAVEAAMLVGFTAYSCLLLKADADFANFSRTATDELIRLHTGADQRVWYSGQWGFYWYADQAGAKVIDRDLPGPIHNDLLLVGSLETNESMLQKYPNRQLIDEREYRAPYGWTVGGGGGLYTNHAGHAPWAWSPEFTASYRLYRIR